MIFRTVKDKNYMIVSNDTYMKDKELSFGAIGLMTILLSCKDDTNFSLNFISIITGKSSKVVTKYLNELKKHRYIYVNKENSKDGFIYSYFIYESKTFNPYYIHNSPDDQNPTWESPPLDLSITNKYYNKQDKIDINRINLCFLTEYLIEWEFIKVNDINLLGYDDFLIKLLSEYKDEYKLVIKVVNYVVKRIKSNKYLDEEGNEIRNLLSYFISSCESNITMLKENEDLVIDDNFWLEGLDSLYK